MPVHYSKSEGLVIHWDYISSLPIIYKKVRLNYGIFRKGSDMYAYKQLRDEVCVYESYRANKSVVLEREVIRDEDNFPDVYIFIELWGY